MSQLKWSSLLGLLLLASAAAHSQSYPAKPIRLVSPLSPGGGNDTLSRFIGKHLTEELGQQIVVENRPGGGGLVGGEYVARAAPDGYTLLTGGSGQIVVSLNYKGRLDMLKDFTPIAIVDEYASLLAVHPSMPVRTVADIIKPAKSQPGNGSGGWHAGTVHRSHQGGPRDLRKAHSSVQVQA